MSNQSIVEHKANMFYVEFREDYLAICLACAYKKPTKGKSKASPYCKALILSISEGWTNDKRSKGADLSFYMTYPQWIESMYGMFGRNVVIDSIDELIGEELLGREPVKYKGKDTFRYTLSHAEINTRMKTLPDCAPYNTRPQVNALISKRDDKSTGLQVNGMAFTNQPDTSLQVNGNALKSKRNIESTYHPYTESAQNTESTYSEQSTPSPSGAAIALPTPALSSQDEPYAPDFARREVREATDEEAWAAYKRIEPQYARTNQMLANGEIPNFAQQQTTLVASEQDSVADENESHSQLSTAPVDKPRQSAKLAPKQGKTASEPKPKRPRTKAAPVVPEFSPEGRKVYDAWCSLFKSPPRVGPKTVECADALYPLLVPWCKELKLSCKDLLNEIKGQMYATDTSGFYKRGITLCDVERDFEKWQSAKTQEMERPKSSEPDDPISYTQRRLAAQRTLAKPKDSGMVLWHDSAGVERMMTYAEADENGWNGGFGEYIQHTHYGRTIV